MRIIDLTLLGVCCAYRSGHESAQVVALLDTELQSCRPGNHGIRGSYIYQSGLKELSMVLEIPRFEFENDSLHRLSVIAHEYFHLFQISNLNANAALYSLPKWLVEGSAATFESLYIQNFYSENYFLMYQTSVDAEAIENPKVLENYDYREKNYSSSVFAILVLAKELQKKGYSEISAFKLILKEFTEKQPIEEDWESRFKVLFQFPVESFYHKLSTYAPNIASVLPSADLTIDAIFENK